MPRHGTREGITAGAGGYQRTLRPDQPQASGGAGDGTRVQPDPEQPLPAPVLDDPGIYPPVLVVPSPCSSESRGPRAQQARGRSSCYHIFAG